jgi:hypothetical protein
VRATRLLPRAKPAYKKTSRRAANAPELAVHDMATIRFVYKGLSAGTPASGAQSASADAATELKPVKVDRWWRESSFDLWQGLEVREDPPDTMPAQWLDDIEPHDKR